MSLLKSIRLRPDEKIIQIVHPYWLTYFWWYFLSFFLVVAPFFFMFWLFAHGQWGLGLFIAALLLGIYFLFRTIFLWYYNALVITSQRLINILQVGAWNRQVSEVGRERISKVSYAVKGLLQTLFKYGTVKVESEGGQADLILTRLHQPMMIQDLISKNNAASLFEQINHLSVEDLKKLADFIENKTKPNLEKKAEL